MTTTYSIKQATPTDVATFINALHAAEPFEDVENLLEVLTDHHKWEAEYGKWLSLGKPMSEEDDAFDDWTEYVLSGVGYPEPASVAGEQEDGADQA